jgi:hypothetical protein
MATVLKAADLIAMHVTGQRREWRARDTRYKTRPVRIVRLEGYPGTPCVSVHSPVNLKGFFLLSNPRADEYLAKLEIIS